MRKRMTYYFAVNVAPSLRWIVSAYAVLAAITVSGQSDIRSSIIEKTKSQYLHVVNMGDSLFAITDLGDLVIWTLTTLDTVQTGIEDSAHHFSVITRAGASLWLGCADGKIYSYQISTRALNLRYQCKRPVYAIAISSFNKCWIANEDGVYDPETQNTWDHFSNHPSGRVYKQKKSNEWIRLTTYYSSPQFDFMDSENRWWLAARYGEFGGDLELFNTSTRKILSNRFDSLNINLFFPQSISEIPGKGILISSGLQHLGNFGELLLIDRNYKLTRLFSSWNFFVGPAAYNPLDSCIYFALDQGIHKAPLLPNGKLGTPLLLFGTRLKSVQEHKAVGQAMPVKQIFFTPRGLVFLTAFNGIGFYDGKGVSYLQ